MSLDELVQDGLFDSSYYAGQAGRSFTGPGEALQHYVEEGWRRGLNPSHAFDTGFYLRHYPDVRAGGRNPLLHYIAAGRREARRPRLALGLIADKPSPPSAARWRELAAAPPAATRDDTDTVDIVVPVYRGYADTLACLASVLSSRNLTRFRLVVIDDFSPEPALSAELERLAGLGLFELVRNTENLGFVRTANLGMRLSRSRDLVLLNSDTVVHADWLDRLRAHVRGNERVGTATPLSNNATILSYPYTLENNNQVSAEDSKALDALCGRVLSGLGVEIPTGVGFCFYIARQCIDAIGAFNEAVFGRGYGEENDFCVRAAQAGWRNLAACDVYVRHTGEVSFGPDAEAGLAENLRRLNELHPHYGREVQEFIRADPLKEVRRKLDLASVAERSAGRGVLMVDHGWGGGIETHFRDLAVRLSAEGILCLRAWAPPERDRIQLSGLVDADFPNLPDLPLPDVEATAQLLQTLNLGRVHIHSLVFYPLRWIEAFIAAIGRAGLEYDFTVHDYAGVCPRIQMIDWGGRYCDSPSPDYCRICIAKAGTIFGPVDISEWRTVYTRVLQGARRVFVPDPDVSARLARYLPDLPQIRLRPHPPLRKETGNGSSSRRSRETTVALIGGIGPHKGSQVLLTLAGDALQRRLPLRFVVFGKTDRAELQRFPNVTVLGKYAEEEIDNLLQEHPCDLALFPSVWPETFCYTLDLAFRHRLHPVAFDLGAIARRLKSTGRGTVLDFDLMFRPGELNDVLLGIPREAELGPPLEPGRIWRSADLYYEGLPAQDHSVREA